GEWEHLDTILNGFADTKRFDEIVIYWRDGTRQSMRGATPDVGGDPACLAVARRSIERNAASVDLHRHASGDIVVAFAAPVFRGDVREPEGAVVLETLAERWLFPFFTAMTAGASRTEAMLVGRDGDSARYLTPLAFGTAQPFDTLRPLSTPGLAVAAALDGKRVTGTYVDYRGVPVIAAARPIGGTPWAIVVKMDKERGDRALRGRLARDGAVLGLCLVTIGSLLVVAIRAQERRALAANERLAAVLKYASDAILFLDREGRIEEANRRAEQLYGRTRAELLSLSLSDLRDPSVAGSAAEELVRAESSASRAFRTIHHSASGAALAVEISSRFIEAEGIRGFIVIVRDVSDVAAAELRVRRLNEELERRVIERTAQLADANRELEAFSYSVSHDLRAPLRAIDGFSKILSSEHAAALDDEGRRLLEVIRSSTHRMGCLIDDLLEFSRAGRRELRKRSVDMAEIARTTAAGLTQGSPPSPVRVAIDELPPATCDLTLIRQVWRHLLDNAVKFSRMRTDATVEVGFRREGGRTIYFVRDDGVGFDMKYADKLFGVFQRLHTQTDFEGTGVGLAMVRRIVHRHGGEVWAEGEVGRGATFYFSLPDDGPSAPPG
ncbi:MAG: ATP-binding protein, partial [Thermoanaerobaculia bacterium]|nr:ATP-binding protein [Thermoanaerobaculia bacterium]